MKVILLIGSGSFIGGVLRYLISQFIHSRQSASFPFGTLVVNIIGCLLIGLVYGLTERHNAAAEWRLFLATGLLGGFTTLSAFSHETIVMLRESQFWSAGAYIASSVIFGLIATILGILLARLFA